MNSQQLNRNVLTDQLYTILKEKILSHALSAGDKINIDELARNYCISNIPIREALFRLVSGGFVRNVPYKGMFVADMNLKDIDEIFEIRTQLEELSLRKAAPKIPKVLLQSIIEAMIRNLGKLQEDKEEAVIAQLNYDLHGTILSYADNQNLESYVTTLIERIHRYLNLVHYKIDINAEKEEHIEIVQALLADDIEKAVLAMRRHIENSHERLRLNF
ncbi:MAG: GntR family transcriptional regulator [Paenibacillaceae bacterium]